MPNGAATSFPKGFSMTAYSVKIRFDGSISYFTVNANSAGQAKPLVPAQHGNQMVCSPANCTTATSSQLMSGS